MALGIGDNFSYKGKKANFERDSFTSKALMKAFPESDIDEGHVSYCEEDGRHYVFKHNNPVDAVTGKWREFSGGAFNFCVEGDMLVANDNAIDGEILII